ncbi:sensor histidine kinase [Myceligenerans pegani]|uniref:histidine kinase n=1 Tax=Myceligenerans pegani TaxID=2776917 RepID=A0ABR9MUU1_9MICO|nr:HAMP domain-containing sensor histidine kinase [Myceligenerans sp. TRM 65318]MBE1874811.1 HAMP domain-containing histidine kinase [Myceligenerans sp. TRM 65318]MBE3017082.1 HAMP domain-containing histidine kinase [Myceligenerans sp. TRM 65318]
MTLLPPTLRARLVATLLLVLLAFTLVVATASTLALRSQLTVRLDEELVQASRRAAEPPPLALVRDRLLGTRPGDTATGTPPTDDPRGTDDPASTDPGLRGAPWLGQNTGTLVIVYADGEVVRAGYLTGDGAFAALTGDQIAALERVPADARPHAVDVPDLGSYRAVATTTSAGEPSVLAMPTSDVTDTLTRYVAVEIVIGVAGMAVAAAAGTWLVRRSLRPLDEVAAAAVNASDLELARGEVGAIPRVPAAHTDERTEVGKVGAALNRLLGHVEQALTARHDSESQVRQFVADASHELRTPLASVRGYAELARRPGAAVDHALTRIEAESERMGGLVNDLLLLARLDAGRPLERAPVDLVALAADALGDAHAAGPDHVWELELDGSLSGEAESDGAEASGAESDGADDDAGPPEAIVVGDEARLRQVFANLLGNARMHTPEGTRVVVSVRTERPPSSRAAAGDGTGGATGRTIAVVSVSDDGPGIPAELRGTLFQRFTRGDRARGHAGGSTGLGLAIVAAIVAAHDGEVTVAGPPAGRGTTMEVRIPLVAPGRE